MPRDRCGTGASMDKRKKRKTKLQEVLENIVLVQVSFVVILFVTTLPGILQVLIGLTFFGVVFVYGLYVQKCRGAVLEAADISLLNKPVHGLVNILALLVFLIAAHGMLLTYAAEPRFWVQNKLADIDDEAHAVLQEALGDHYVLVPTSLYYAETPYYYTFFDAIYNWNRLSRETGFYACANSSKACVPGVWADAPYYESWFDDFWTMLNQTASASSYCIGGIEGLVEDAESEAVSPSSSTEFLWFNTQQGGYTLVGITEEQRERWQGAC